MFCEKCGSQIPEGTNVCPNCAAVNNPTPAPAPAPAPEQVYQQAAPQQQAYQQPVYQQAAPAANGGGLGTVGTICGIASLIVAILGGILFGAIAALIGVILGVVGLIIGINTKKKTGGAKGTGGFVCGLLGLIFGLLFTVGCAACGSCTSCGGVGGYGCYGLVGGNCKMKCDMKNVFDDYNFDYDDLFSSLEDLY